MLPLSENSIVHDVIITLAIVNAMQILGANFIFLN